MDGKTASAAALLLNHSFLLPHSHGADVLIRDHEGRSVFHWAVKSPNIQALKTLHKQGTAAIINTAVSQLS